VLLSTMAGAVLTHACNAITETLRNTTPTGNAPTAPGSSGTQAHADVTGTATVVRPAPSSAGTGERSFAGLLESRACDIWWSIKCRLC
jgi:hypothetical protein